MQPSAIEPAPCIDLSWHDVEHRKGRVMLRIYPPFLGGQIYILHRLERTWD